MSIDVLYFEFVSMLWENMKHSTYHSRMENWFRIFRVRNKFQTINSLRNFLWKIFLLFAILAVLMPNKSRSGSIFNLSISNSIRTFICHFSRQFFFVNRNLILLVVSIWFSFSGRKISAIKTGSKCRIHKPHLSQCHLKIFFFFV